LSVLSQQIFQDDNVQHGIRQKPLQSGVLRLQGLQLAGVRHVHAAEPGFPFIEASRADPVLATDLRRRHTALLFVKNRDNVPAAAFALQMVNLQSSVNLDFLMSVSWLTDSPFK